MKYFKGDIVEIVTAKYKSFNDIPLSERGYYENQGIPAPFIGQRFRVNSISENMVGAKVNGRICLQTSKDCVTLYKRSLINKFKSHINSK